MTSTEKKRGFQEANLLTNSYRFRERRGGGGEQLCGRHIWKPPTPNDPTNHSTIGAFHDHPCLSEIPCLSAYSLAVAPLFLELRSRVVIARICLAASLPVHCIVRCSAAHASSAHAGVSKKAQKGDRCRKRRKRRGVAFEEAVILRLIITTARLTDRGGRIRGENGKNYGRAVAQ